MCITSLILICSIVDNGVQNLSGGELQRVAIVLALGTPANIYLVSDDVEFFIVAFLVQHMLFE